MSLVYILIHRKIHIFYTHLIMCLYLIIDPYDTLLPPWFVFTATDGKTCLFGGKGDKMKNSTWERSGRSLLS